MSRLKDCPIKRAGAIQAQAAWAMSMVALRVHCKIAGAPCSVDEEHLANEQILIFNAGHCSEERCQLWGPLNSTTTICGCRLGGKI